MTIMETISIFLAKFWGWYFVIFCLLILTRPKRVVQIFEYIEDKKFLVLTSLIAIIVGLLNILAHNVWEFSWKLIITLIGWISLTKGIIGFSFPKASLKLLNLFSIKLIPYLMVLVLILGVFLLNRAYLWVPY